MGENENEGVRGRDGMRGKGVRGRDGIDGI